MLITLITHLDTTSRWCEKNAKFKFRMKSLDLNVEMYQSV